MKVAFGLQADVGRYSSHEADFSMLSINVRSEGRSGHW
jgi:hypothetical protein